jgi:hypothetical protein
MPRDINHDEWMRQEQWHHDTKHWIDDEEEEEWCTDDSILAEGFVPLGESETPGTGA